MELAPTHMRKTKGDMTKRMKGKGNELSWEIDTHGKRNIRRRKERGKRKERQENQKKEIEKKQRIKKTRCHLLPFIF